MKETVSTPPRNRFESLDGLRAYSAIGIVVMHVLLNLHDKPNMGLLSEKIIPWFANLVLLFMVISAFSMCCGYYERIKKGKILPSDFYKKRYHRTLPFFALMVMISFFMEPSLDTFCQSFANLTMCFNLLPNPQIEVIGVGWFLGTVFTFYMLFPFFVFLLDNKKRGWIVLGVSLIFSVITMTYFSNPEMVVKPVNRVNIIVSSPFFVVGGLVYLYRQKIKVFWVNKSIILLAVVILLTSLRFVFPLNGIGALSDLIVFGGWLIYAICNNHKWLSNRVVTYLSGISMEIYLCHMMFFRVVEKLSFDSLSNNMVLNYSLASFLTLGMAIVFSHVVKYKCFPKVIDSLRKLKALTF